MNVFRFVGKCIADPSAAKKSGRLLARSIYGKTFWQFYPEKALKHRLEGGGLLYLWKEHSFTTCYWPAVEDYEPEVREALRFLLRPGSTFIDCGANVGYFSVFAQHLVGEQGHVIALEANPATFELLKVNLNANGLERAVNCAVTSEGEEVNLYVPESGDVYSSIRHTSLTGGSPVQTVRVRGKSLDQIVEELNLSSLDVVKVDVEGGELDVLRSASRILKVFRPVFIVEYGTNTWPAFGVSPEDLRCLCADIRYEITRLDAPERTFIPVDEMVWTLPYTNLILVPEEGGFTRGGSDRESAV